MYVHICTKKNEEALSNEEIFNVPIFETPCINQIVNSERQFSSSNTSKKKLDPRMGMNETFENH